jgi:phosphatidylglycerophosphate synthase
MFDRFARSLIDGPLNKTGLLVARTGVSANQLSLAGAAAGLCAALAVASGYFMLGLAFIIVSRGLDGLDGAVARATKPTDFGGYLDILCDYVFYVGVPLGFALAAPENRLPALFLVASFVLSGTSFLAYAALAEKRGLKTDAQGQKSFYYMAGLAEGSETIAVFVLFCLLPEWFGLLAYAFAALCVATMVGRALQARAVFTSDTTPRD